LGGRTSTFTRRSAVEALRRTRPRDSRRSTSPVTFDAWQASASASSPMGTGRSGSIKCSTWHWTGESRSSAAREGRLARWAGKSRTSRGQGARGGAGFIQDRIGQYRRVDILKDWTEIAGMGYLRLVSLEDAVVFPGMPVTLTADVAGDTRVLLIPRRANGFARVGVVAEVAERVALGGRAVASFNPLHRGLP